MNRGAYKLHKYLCGAFLFIVAAAMYHLLPQTMHGEVHSILLFALAGFWSGPGALVCAIAGVWIFTSALTD